MLEEKKEKKLNLRKDYIKKYNDLGQGSEKPLLFKVEMKATISLDDASYAKIKPFNKKIQRKNRT